MGDPKPEKQSKRKGRRGKKKNPAKQTATKVTFKDPAPPGDRYNLVFHAHYKPKEVLLREVDERYFKFYHEDLPNAYQNWDPWKGKPPSSRWTFKADKIFQVHSILDIASGLMSFINTNASKKKKFGTILISAHGWATAVSLPVTKGAQIISVADMAAGLRAVYGGSIGTKPPYNWSQGDWDKIRKPLNRLELELAMLHKRIDAWVDEHTLIRFWVCNVGQAPKGGAPDPLRTFGRVFVPRSPVMLEAPKVRSEGNFHSFTGNTPGSYIWNYVRKVKQKGVKARSDALHPDVVADTESKMNHLRFTGSALKDARSNFGDEMLTPGPPPGMISGRKWIPMFSLEKKRKKKKSISVFPGDKNFDGMWRKVSLKKDERP